MERERHKRISELFDRVCDLPPSERREYLQGACVDDPSLATDVERLLEAELEPILLAPALGSGFSLTGAADVAPEEDAVYRRNFGPYRVQRCISAGSTAVVYEAEQEHPQRVVALKVLRGGFVSRSALRRFHLETEVLGRLEHPGIARIYVAGTTSETTDGDPDSGLPYFAMEWIDGVTITDYATAKQLDARGRMELVAMVCDAVQHAHQHGVIHRDLKPANILVDGAGQPRIVDFGVARAVDNDLQATSMVTEAGQLVGTLPYMSPEQVLGDPRAVDTRTDVYALGVILYELLTGRLPHPVRDVALPEAARIIREDEPVALASVDPLLRGDPATIAGRALEKDKQRRYQSAAELGADIRRYLADEPIMARPATMLYQLGKMARRNKAAFAALAVVLMTLAGATTVSAWMAVVTKRAKVRALEALRDSDRTSEYLLDVFLESPDQPVISRQSLLERAELRLTEKPIARPRVEAKIREYIGHGWHKLAYLENAEPHLVRALELRRSVGARDVDLAQCLLLLAMQRLTQGRIQDGQAALREALAIRRVVLGPDHMEGVLAEELKYWTTLYTPDEPEALRELERQRALRELAPVQRTSSLDLPMVLEEEFDGDALAPAWLLEWIGSVGWTHTIAGSRLTVTDIHPAKRPDESLENLRAFARLTRALDQPLGDFRVEARIGWDSEGDPAALQYVVVLLHGPARHLVASAHYGDDWLQYGGARKAMVGRYSSTVRYVNSGRDTLPDHGSADLTIERRGEHVTVYWDGHELMRGHSADPLEVVAIDFSWNVHSGSAGRSSFGTEWIDSIRVMGTRSDSGR